MEASKKYIPVTVLKVHCWGNYVGALVLDQNTNFYAFEYAPSFQSSGTELAPLTLPLNESGPALFTHLPERTYYRLPPFIADSLPDDFGNSLINAWMASRGTPPDDVSALDRLAYIGSRGMGALEYVPAIEGIDKLMPSALDVSELTTEARKAALAQLNNGTALSAENDLAQLIQIGTSAGGARAKAVVGFNPANETFISGQFDVPVDYDHWIIKFDISSDEPGHYGKSQKYGRIEYAYYLMARACGINMEESRLYEASGRAHFMTKRFDRGSNNERHHIQTLCAMAQLDFNQVHVHDYHQLFQTALQLGLPLQSQDELFRRMVFNVACFNKDDHTKNHSFKLQQGGSWELSPAYDITHSSGFGQNSRQAMGVGGAFVDINRENIMSFTQRYQIRNPESILDSVLNAADNWAEYAETAGLKVGDKDQVGKNINHCRSLLLKA